MYEERRYRNMFKGINLKFFDVCIKETDIRIGADRELRKEAYELALNCRRDIEEYIADHQRFLESLEPIDCSNDAPDIIKRMCEAAKKAGVGPMAAVAGAVSEFVGMGLLKMCNEVIVENGGDIFMKSDVPRKVGVYAGKSRLSEKIALEIMPDKTPLGICTSSGTVGHSLSFGRADAVVIVSKDTFLSDAVATATGNVVKDEGYIEKGIEFASSIDGVDGVLIIVGDSLGAWGDIKLVKL
ncbi:MAG TPA: UPF0280 family protein [Acetivibrio sp.]|nr:UPF0280 family protein [Acetivibrio sp.]